ncbi:hypothetical protein U1Q18_031529 [Sarracenia purpurea var. burkii]
MSAASVQSGASFPVSVQLSGLSGLFCFGICIAFASVVLFGVAIVLWQFAAASSDAIAAACVYAPWILLLCCFGFAPSPPVFIPVVAR